MLPDQGSLSTLERGWQLVRLLQWVLLLSKWRHKQERPDWTAREFLMALARLGGHQNRKGVSMCTSSFTEIGVGRRRRWPRHTASVWPESVN